MHRLTPEGRVKCEQYLADLQSAEQAQARARAAQRQGR